MVDPNLAFKSLVVDPNLAPKTVWWIRILLLKRCGGSESFLSISVVDPNPFFKVVW